MSSNSTKTIFGAGVASAKTARENSKANRVKQDLFIGKREHNPLLRFAPEIH
jgi:hypothetical protein